MSTSTIWYDALSTSRVSVGRQSIRSDKSDPVGSIDVEKDKKAVKKLMSEKRYLEACHLLGRCLKLAEDPSEITRLPLFEDLCNKMHGFYLVMDIDTNIFLSNLLNVFSKLDVKLFLLIV